MGKNPERKIINKFKTKPLKINLGFFEKTRKKHFSTILCKFLYQAIEICFGIGS